MTDSLFSVPCSLDEAFIAIPLDGSEDASFRLALVVRKQADPSEGPFCRLRQLAEATVFLGCIIDRANRVLQWLELWVRDYDNVADSVHENAFDIINNTVMDARWERQRTVLSNAGAVAVLSTTLDEQLGYPLYIDMYNKVAVAPKDDQTQTYWTVCKEDNLLRRLGLPTFSGTLHRYLYLEPLGAESVFLPITPNAPTNSHTKSPDAVISGRSTLIPFSRYCGAIIVRSVAPLSLIDFLNVLEGKAWTGMGAGRKQLLPSGVYREISEDLSIGYAAGRLLSARPDSRTWKLENLYLKVRLFYEVVQLVKRCIELDRKPFFSLETSSFAVHLSSQSASAPFLWDAEVAINQVSETLDFAVEKQTDIDSRETTYFRTFRPLSASIYRPEAVGQQKSLLAEVTLLELRKDRETGLYQIEGSLRSSDLQQLNLVGKNLYFIHYPIRGKRLRLTAEMTGMDPQLPDKIRFQTAKIRLTSEHEIAIKAMRGVEQNGTYCELLPVLGSPCDLYSLGVIGMEILYYGSGSSLALIKDSLRTLALRCDDTSEEKLTEKIFTELKKDEQLSRILLPNKLGVAASGTGQIGIPPEDRIWEGLLAVVIKCLSGLLSNTAYCRSLSNESNFRIAQIFDEPLKELSSYTAILRALCIGDVHSAHTIRKVIDRTIMNKSENQTS